MRTFLNISLLFSFTLVLIALVAITAPASAAEARDRQEDPDKPSETRKPIGNSGFEIVIPQIKMKSIVGERPKPKPMPESEPQRPEGPASKKEDTTPQADQAERPPEQAKPQTAIPVDEEFDQPPRESSQPPQEGPQPGLLPALPQEPPDRLPFQRVPIEPAKEFDGRPPGSPDQGAPAKEALPVAPPRAPEEVRVVPEPKKEILDYSIGYRLPRLIGNQPLRGPGKTHPVEPLTTEPVDGAEGAIPFESRKAMEVIPAPESEPSAEEEFDSPPGGARQQRADAPAPEQETPPATDRESDPTPSSLGPSSPVVGLGRSGQYARRFNPYSGIGEQPQEELLPPLEVFRPPVQSSIKPGGPEAESLEPPAEPKEPEPTPEPTHTPPSAPESRPETPTPDVPEAPETPSREQVAPPEEPRAAPESPDPDRELSPEPEPVEPAKETVPPPEPPAEELFPSPLSEEALQDPEVRQYLRAVAPLLEELQLLIMQTPELTVAGFDPSETRESIVPEDVLLRLESVRRGLQVLDSKTFAIIPPKNYTEYHSKLRESISHSYQACDALMGFLSDGSAENLPKIQNHLDKAFRLIEMTRRPAG